MRLDVWFSWNIYSCMREERRGESGNEGKWKASGGENKFWIFQTAVNVFVFVFRAKTSLESFIERKFSFFLFWKISLFGQRKNGKWNFKNERIQEIIFRKPRKKTIWKNPISAGFSLAELKWYPSKNERIQNPLPLTFSWETFYWIN